MMVRWDGAAIAQLAVAGKSQLITVVTNASPKLTNPVMRSEPLWIQLLLKGLTSENCCTWGPRLQICTLEEHVGPKLRSTLSISKKRIWYTSLLSKIKRTQFSSHSRKMSLLQLEAVKQIKCYGGRDKKLFATQFLILRSLLFYKSLHSCL